MPKIKQKPDQVEFSKLLADLCEKNTDSSYIPENDEIQYYTDYSKVVDDLLKVCNIQMKPQKATQF